MDVNFRAHEISQGAHKLIRTSKLIKKIINFNSLVFKHDLSTAKTNILQWWLGIIDLFVARKIQNFDSLLIKFNIE